MRKGSSALGASRWGRGAVGSETSHRDSIAIQTSARCISVPVLYVLFDHPRQPHDGARPQLRFFPSRFILLAFVSSRRSSHGSTKVAELGQGELQLASVFHRPTRSARSQTRGSDAQSARSPAVAEVQRCARLGQIAIWSRQLLVQSYTCRVKMRRGGEGAGQSSTDSLCSTTDGASSYSTASTARTPAAAIASAFSHSSAALHRFRPAQRRALLAPPPLQQASYNCAQSTDPRHSPRL